jgi:hypothetical protein
MVTFIASFAYIRSEGRLRYMESIIPFISEVGFPIVVTMYLLYRIETKLDAVVTSIQTLPQRMKE